jgi:SEC-C motif
MDMGAIANGIMAYVKPLIDKTDGSSEEMEKALVIGQLCYNLALLQGDNREKTLNELRQDLKMNDADFDEFRRTVVVPMIQRHQAMFPRMHARGFTDPPQDGNSPPARPTSGTSAGKFPGTDRYAPCPCNSGEKYKFCCGGKGR